MEEGFEDDLELITDGTEEKERKKKVDGKGKGDRGELMLGKFLGKHFGHEFSRGVGSGNRWSHVKEMPQHAKDTFLGDICTPDGFAWVIECKNGYDDDIDLNNAFHPIAELDKWITKALRDSELSGRKPIICWKRKWKPWIAILRQIDYDDWSDNVLIDFDYYMSYRDWMIVELQVLLDKTPEGYWYRDGKS